MVSTQIWTYIILYFLKKYFCDIHDDDNDDDDDGETMFSRSVCTSKKSALKSVLCLQKIYGASIWRFTKNSHVMVENRLTSGSISNKKVCFLISMFLDTRNTITRGDKRVQHPSSHYDFHTQFSILLFILLTSHLSHAPPSP